ncbi:MAG: hypothetical protein AB4063_14400 [Crocosphaera sp.]
MDQRECYFSVYQEYREHARHSESTRETTSNFLLAISAAIIGVMTMDEKVSCQDTYLGLILIVLGWIGFFSSLAYTARYHRNRIRAFHIKQELDKLYTSDNNNQDNRYEFGTLYPSKNNNIKSLQTLTQDADQEYEDIRSQIFPIIWIILLLPTFLAILTIPTILELSKITNLEKIIIIIILFVIFGVILVKIISSIWNLLKNRATNTNNQNLLKTLKTFLNHIEEMMKEGGHHVVWLVLPILLICVAIVLTGQALNQCPIQ